jgi:hypothetical protein
VICAVRKVPYNRFSVRLSDRPSVRPTQNWFFLPRVICRERAERQRDRETERQRDREAEERERERETERETREFSKGVDELRPVTPSVT